MPCAGGKTKGEASPHNAGRPRPRPQRGRVPESEGHGLGRGEGWAGVLGEGWSKSILETHLPSGPGMSSPAGVFYPGMLCQVWL